MRIPSEEEIKDSINRSGYLFEVRLSNLLHEKGYWVESNPIYEDITTNKSREIDAFCRYGEQHKYFHYLVEHFLIIEAKKSPVPVLFFEKDWKNDGDDDDFLYNQFFHRKIAEDLDIDLYPEYSSYTEKIDQLPKSTQYCSFKPKKRNKDEWMAYHPNNLHSSIESLLFFSKNRFEGFSDSKFGNDVQFKHWTFVPILVISADIKLGRIVDGELKIKTVPRVNYLASSIKEGERIQNRIEVVTESHLPNLLDEFHQFDKKIIEKVYDV